MVDEEVNHLRLLRNNAKNNVPITPEYIEEQKQQQKRLIQLEIDKNNKMAQERYDHNVHVNHMHLDKKMVPQGNNGINQSKLMSKANPFIHFEMDNQFNSYNQVAQNEPSKY
jgi:hypothetical protein